MKARKPDRSGAPEDPTPSSGPKAPTPLLFAEGKPRPIGPEALKALREAIRNGTYPNDRAVQSGLLRMFRRP